MSTKGSGEVETSPTTADVSSAEPTWNGPFVEPLEQGGEMYWECDDCGAEVLDGQRDQCSHREGCSA